MKITNIRTLHSNFLGYTVTLVASPTSFVALAYLPTQHIYVSELFLSTYTPEEQQAILAHEVGHIELHQQVAHGHTLVQELEADRFSAEKVGFRAVASALKKTIALAKKRHESGISSKDAFRKQQMEHSHRISNLLDYANGRTKTLAFFQENLS